MRCRCINRFTTLECVTIFATSVVILICFAVINKTFLKDVIFAENRYDFIEEYETGFESTASKLLSLDKTGYLFAQEQARFNNGKLKKSVRENKKILPELENETHYTFIDNSIIEHNPNIDDNLPPDSYKWYLKDQKYSVDCNLQLPKKWLVYLRSHRTGSQTLSNIFYRYGELNNLYFALPNAPTFKHYWPLRFHHSHVDKSLINKVAPNFLIDVARTQVSRIKSFVSRETVFIGVVRNPIDHFQSLYDYMDISYFMALISNGTDLFSEFASNPLEKTSQFVNKTKKYEPIFDLIKNPQLYDLGFEKKDYKTKLDLKFLIREIDEQFDFVLVNEYMDESLVLLQRKLCWQLSDVIYLKQRVRKNRQPISEKTKKDILRWNQEDEFLYNYFNESLWETLFKQDKTFWDDVKKLKSLSAHLNNKCVESEDKTVSLSKKEGVWKRDTFYSGKESNSDKVFIPRKHISKEVLWICERALLNEIEYISLLKTKQRQLILKENAELWGKSYFVDNNENKHFDYPIKNKRFLVENKKIENDEALTVKEETDEENTEVLL
ncbi:galactosylceramide sulfotransferase isoform X1 [Hydra vulgaris]|uniref:galactosylceramide sulfotransferase isoform X1 n=1 Tax=Hydra vulgaris TaxID=6087 RepID=UPI001F5FAAC3|nr:galactosylceramide sulfotransferase [Hydra vulgaris]